MSLNSSRANAVPPTSSLPLVRGYICPTLRCNHGPTQQLLLLRPSFALISFSMSSAENTMFCFLSYSCQYQLEFVNTQVSELLWCYQHHEEFFATSLTSHLYAGPTMAVITRLTTGHRRVPGPCQQPSLRACSATIHLDFYQSDGGSGTAERAVWYRLIIRRFWGQIIELGPSCHPPVTTQMSKTCPACVKL